MIKPATVSLGLLCAAICYASDQKKRWPVQLSDRQYLELIYQIFPTSDDTDKKKFANTLIKKGMLHGILVNGDWADHDGNEQSFKAFVMECLKCGDTVTASPRMLDKAKLKNSVLDIENMGLVTVRDWKQEDWFNEVKVINLSYNQLTEIPCAFYRMFSNLEKIDLSHNPIQFLDTTSMPYGLVVTVEHTKLTDIIPTNNLHAKKLEIHIYGTPLSQYPNDLARYRAACNAKRSNCLYILFNKCRGKEPQLEEDTSSTINTLHHKLLSKNSTAVSITSCTSTSN